MKNMKVKSILNKKMSLLRIITAFALSFAVIFAITGCGNLFENLEQPQQNAAQNGSISFSIDSVSGSYFARTANPTAQVSNLSNISLTGTFNGATETLGSWNSTSEIPSLISLSSGSWNFTLSATLNGCSFTGTKTATITGGANTQLVFNLQAASTVNYGGINIRINYTATDEPTYITAQLKDISNNTAVGNAVTLTPETSTTPHYVLFTRDISTAADGSNTSGRISSGTYRLTLSFYAGENAATVEENRIFLNSYSTVVNVASGLVSTDEQTIDLNKLNTISYNDPLSGNPVSGQTKPELYSIQSVGTGIALPEMVKTGYTFVGWYEDSGFTGDVQTSIPAGSYGAKEYWAKWTCTVTFDTNGGTGTVDSQNVTYNHRVTVPTTNPTKDDLAFVGWCSDAAGETPFDFAETTITAATTLYAKWNPIYATINDVNYGTLADTVTAISNVDSTTDITVKLTSNVTQEAIGKADTAYTIAHAIKNTTAKSVSLVVPATETIAISGDASYIFKQCEKLVSADLRGFDTSEATFIYDMFYGCSALTSVNVTSFDTRKVTNMMGLFEGCSSLTSVDIGNFVTNQVDGISMHAMFQGCSSLTSIDLSGFDTSKADSFTNMFTNCTSLTQLDISNFTLSDNANALSMFYGCSNLEMIIVSNEFAAAMSNLSHSYSENMFEGCTKLVGANGTEYDSNYTDSTYARLDVAGTPGYFTPASDYAVVNGAEYEDLTDITSAITSATGNLRIILGASITANDIGTGQQGSGMDDGSIVYAIHTLETNMGQNQQEIRVSLIVKEDANINLNENCSGMFALCEFDTLDLRGVATSQVTSMENMFGACMCRKSLNISSFNTSNVQNMSNMFTNYNNGIYENRILDISSFNLSNVNNVEDMFYGCATLTTIIVSDSFEVPSGANSNQMFYSCSSIVGGAGTTYDDNQIDATYAHIDGGIDNPGYFTAAQ